jgi:hypothetical protein
MDNCSHTTIDVEALVAEIYRYLAVVECFRREGYLPGRKPRLAPPSPAAV